MQQLLDLVRELMRTKGARVAKPWGIVREIGVLQFLLEIAILDTVDLEREEQEHG
jgi:hypothetical protein